MDDNEPHGYRDRNETTEHGISIWDVDERTALERILSMSDRDIPDARHAFHKELDSIDDAFVAAGLHVAEALPRLSAGFLAGDRSVIAESEALALATADTCELVDEAGFILLARQAPVSGDLRRLVALLRMTMDVNRSASLLRHACLTLNTFEPRFLAEPLRSQLDELATQSCGVFAAGMDAWRRRDALALSEIDRQDDDVDELQKVLWEEAQRDGDDVGEGMLVLGLLARYFERIADHGVEIARDTAFVATGQRIRVGRLAKQAEARARVLDGSDLDIADAPDAPDAPDAADATDDRAGDDTGEPGGA